MPDTSNSMAGKLSGVVQISYGLRLRQSRYARTKAGPLTFQTSMGSLGERAQTFSFGSALRALSSRALKRRSQAKPTLKALSWPIRAIRSYCSVASWTAEPPADHRAGRRGASVMYFRNHAFAQRSRLSRELCDRCLSCFTHIPLRPAHRFAGLLGGLLGRPAAPSAQQVPLVLVQAAVQAVALVQERLQASLPDRAAEADLLGPGPVLQGDGARASARVHRARVPEGVLQLLRLHAEADPAGQIRRAHGVSGSMWLAAPRQKRRMRSTFSRVST